MASTATVGVASQAATTSDTTEAFAGTNAGLTITGGPLSLQAISNDTAKSGQVAIGISGVGVKVADSDANAGGSTSAYVQEGRRSPRPASPCRPSPPTRPRQTRSISASPR